MARARKQPEPVEEATEEQEEEALAARDFVMARLLAARAAAADAIAAIDEAALLFVDTGDDATGKKRKQLVDEALESAGILCRALESAEDGVLEGYDTEAGEPWEEEEDDD
jgi:hypothetical protein